MRHNTNLVRNHCCAVTRARIRSSLYPTCSVITGQTNNRLAAAQDKVCPATGMVCWAEGGRNEKEGVLSTRCVTCDKGVARSQWQTATSATNPKELETVVA